MRRGQANREYEGENDNAADERNQLRGRGGDNWREANASKRTRSAERLITTKWGNLWQRLVFPEKRKEREVLVPRRGTSTLVQICNQRGCSLDRGHKKRGEWVSSGKTKRGVDDRRRTGEGAGGRTLYRLRGKSHIPGRKRKPSNSCREKKAETPLGIREGRERNAISPPGAPDEEIGKGGKNIHHRRGRLISEGRMRKSTEGSKKGGEGKGECSGGGKESAAFSRADTQKPKRQ